MVGGVHVTTMSNSNASCFRVELSCVALGFDNNKTDDNDDAYCTSVL